jgi:hypothetical protein
VQAIWDQTHQDMNARLEERRAIDQDFQRSVLDLLTSDQKTRYESLRAGAAAKAAAVRTDMQTVVDSSIEKTRAILTQQQREKYDELLARFPATNQPPDGGVDHLSTPPGSIEPSSSTLP